MRAALSLAKPRDLFSPLLFLFFFTLHADQLSLSRGGLTLRVNNVVGLGLLLLFIFRYRHHLFRIDRRLAIALGVIGLSLLISFCLSPYKKRCFLFIGWYGVTLLLYILLPYFMMQVLDTKKVLKLYFASFFLVGLYAALQLPLGPFDPFTNQHIGRLYRPNAMAYEPSYYSLYMTPFVMMVNYRYLVRRKGLKVLFLVNLLYLLSTSTTTIFAYFIFFCVAMPYLKGRAWRFAFIAAIMVGVIALCSPFIMKEFFLKFFIHGRAHHSFAERWLGIENGWHVFCEHPWFGVGLGGYPSHLYHAWLTGSERYLSLYTTANTAIIKNFEPSNVFTEMLASLGLFGATAFGLLLHAFYRQMKKAYAHDPMHVANLFISVVVMVIVLQFNQGLFRTYVWTHFALVFALLEKIQTQTKPLSLEDPLEAFAA